jgi:membrane fusion protein (multidrug efflux system)
MKKNQKIVLYVVLAIGLIILGFKGVNLYRHYAAYESTDDAQVDGNVIPVMARVGGYIEKVYVKENQPVKARDIIAVIDSTEMASKLNQALAALQSAVAQVDVAKASAHDALQARELASLSREIPRTNLWKAQKEFERYQSLFEQRLATPQQLDTYKANLETAQSQFDISSQKTEASELQYQTALSQVKVAEAHVLQKRNDIDFSKIQMSYLKISSPVDGVISRNNIQPGQLVQAGQPLMSVVQNNDVWVTANFKETQMETIKIGSLVNIHVDAYPNLVVNGTVESTGGATGAKFSLIPPDNASGNYVKVVQRVPVRIKINHTAETKSLLKPGLSVDVEVKK